MMNSPKKLIPIIMPGLRIGRIEVIELVYNVQDHELYNETPISYLQQGRLHEVLCDCGRRRLISESILASGRIQSCGCLRKEIRMKATEKKAKRLHKESIKKENKIAIKLEQTRLRTLQLSTDPQKDLKIEECGKNLRRLFAQKAHLNRKESPKETWARKMREFE